MIKSSDIILDPKLEQIKKVFDINDLLELRPDQQYIQRYYKASRLLYSLFFLSTDRMYMGVSRDGHFKPTDLLEAARIVEKYLKQKRGTNVLEIATGRGATSAYLAQRHPAVRFDGVELSPAQLGLAQKKAKRLNNYFPVSGDYHDLSRYPDHSIDIVFVIEALCYSTTKAQVFNEVKRLLKPRGVFIILDGYTLKDRSKMQPSEQLACRLTERGMALDTFETHAKVMKTANDSGFVNLSDEDVSEYIQPSLRRFERHAKLYFRWPSLARLVNHFVSKMMIYNTISALLMPDIVSLKLAGYFITVLESRS